jgi:exopolyphosphatase/guanosine-5'-triphosphate,3'-diphosphate pyrophosphatase
LPSGTALEEAAMEKLRSWASFLDPDVEHTAHVLNLSLQIYDGLLRNGILVSKPEYRRMLEAAAILHEVGRSKTGNGHAGGHQKRAYRKIGKLTPPVGWTQEEIRCIAVIARYHRGTLPLTSNSSFVGLSAKRRLELLPIIGILRLANAFDDEHDRGISQVAVERRDGLVILRASGLQKISPRAEHVARARYLLETSCGMPLMIQPTPNRRRASSPTQRTRRGTSKLVNRSRA